PDFDSVGHENRMEAIGNIFDQLPDDRKSSILVTATIAPGSFPQEKFDSAFREYAQDTGLTREKGQEFVDAYRGLDQQKMISMIENLNITEMDGYMMLMSDDRALQDRLLALLPD
ncbi:MAG TPA: hypothetical protein PKD05_19030, partial [Candidatus Melainabacteria bacterium]|nr:hypothetical protein [Candidatus Melainabacteria bacterium]